MSSKASEVNKGKRFDYLTAHQDIENYISDHVMKNGVFPTQAQIAAGTKISKKTVNGHMKEISFKNYKPRYKALTPKVLLGLYSKALEGNAYAAKVWFQVVEDFKENVRHSNDPENPMPTGVIVLPAMTDQPTNES